MKGGKLGRRSSGEVDRPLRLCFVSPPIYPVLDPARGIRRIGGAEVQQVILGKAFSRHDFEVCYVTCDHGQKEPSQVPGGVAYKAYRPSAGLPGFRFFYPRVPGLWAALRRADADIYYFRGAGYLAGLIAAFAKLHGRKAVIATAHDSHVLPRKSLKLKNPRDRALYLYGLKHADAIVVQSHWQARMLEQHYGRQGHVIRNVWESADPGVVPGWRDSVLWVGMFHEVKRPERVLAIARSCPSLRFVMVGGPRPGSDSLFDQVKQESEGIPNLELTGFRPLSETDGFFSRARVVINTSRAEGFPNTFLQAWAQGVPVVSFVDPDDVIKLHGLGEVATGDAAFPSVLIRAWEAAPALGDQIRSYFLSNHTPASAVSAYEDVFRGLGFHPIPARA